MVGARRRGGVSPVLRVRGVTLEIFFENIGANMCNLVNFGDCVVKSGTENIRWDGIYRPCRIGSAAPDTG